MNVIMFDIPSVVQIFPEFSESFFASVFLHHNHKLGDLTLGRCWLGSTVSLGKAKSWHCKNNRTSESKHFPRHSCGCFITKRKKQG